VSDYRVVQAPDSFATITNGSTTTVYAPDDNPIIESYMITVDPSDDHIISTGKLAPFSYVMDANGTPYGAVFKNFSPFQSRFCIRIRYLLDVTP
jgi:hypothetical protein